MIEAGRLRHRVTIQSPTNTQNETTGEITVTWSDVVTVWAAIEPLSAREFIQSQALQSEISARIVIRYRDGITPAMRIKHGSKYYNIQGVLPDKDSGREYITLPVSEGVGA